jgi:predicted Zn-dependent protease
VAARVRAAAALTLVDDPTSPAAFAGHALDDAGAPARPTTLASGGAPFAAGPWGSARRSGPRWQLARAPTHLELAAGAATAGALESAVAAGVVLDGVRDLRLDDDGYVVVRVSRARELARGQRTGRVWGDLELRGDVGELLAGVIGVSSDRAAVALADDGPARDALVPWLVTRGELAGGPLADARGGR